MKVGNDEVECIVVKGVDDEFLALISDTEIITKSGYSVELDPSNTQGFNG